MPNPLLTEVQFNIDNNQYSFDIADPVARAAIATNGRRVIAWKGDAVPDVTRIPAGVVVTYNGIEYTGTFAASAANEKNMYCVYTPDPELLDLYDEYVVVIDENTEPETRTWERSGNTRMDLSGLGDLAWSDTVLIVKGNGVRVLGENTQFTASAPTVQITPTKSSALTGLGTPSKKNVLQGVSVSKSKKLVKTTVPNVTNAGSLPALQISNQAAACGVGNRVIIAFDKGTLPTLGTPINVATGELSTEGTGSTVVDDVTEGNKVDVIDGISPDSAQFMTGATAQASAPNITVGDNDKMKVPLYNDINVQVNNQQNIDQEIY